MSQPRPPVFTIGHSNHAAEVFLRLLRQHRIEEVVDVRSSPHSRYNPQFNRRTLQATLADAGVGYVFMGGELGGRQTRRATTARGGFNTTGWRKRRRSMRVSGRSSSVPTSAASR